MFSYVLRAIALGRLPGEQRIARSSILVRFVIALVTSGALWYYVTDQENPVVKSQPYTLQVKFTHQPKGLTVRNPNKTVIVYAHGLQSTLNSTQQIIPVADLSRITPSAGEITVPITVVGGRSGVDYTVEPSFVTVQLEPLVSKTVQVLFNAQSVVLPATLYLIADDRSPKVLTISGPADAVNRVSSALVMPPTGTISAPSPDKTKFSYSFASVPVLQDAQGRIVSSSTLLPSGSEVTVNLQIGVILSLKTVTVATQMLSSPPMGYVLTGIKLSPQSVTLLGPPNAVSNLVAVPTSPISLQGLTRSMTITTQLDLQSLGTGIQLYDPVKHVTVPTMVVEVGVKISPQPVTESLAATITIDNLKPGMQAKLNVRWLNVYVKGAFAAVNTLGPLTAHVDARGLVQGSYNLKPQLTLPANLPSYTITPGTVHVVIVPRSK